MDLSLPTGPLAEAILTIVRTSEVRAIADHSVRSFFLADLIGAREGLSYDRDLLYAATVMHDLGTGKLAQGVARFEVEGADLAAGLLREHGVDEGATERVWEAIALHTSGGIAERRGVLAYLTRAGIAADFGADFGADEASELHAEYPRLGMAATLVDAIVEHAGRSAAAGAAYTLGGELLRERRVEGITRLERAAASG
ncbi:MULTISPECIES: HD domain-containing protein [Kribbella]|uniref:HD domain-containing protein n=1 Tax=Kribbella karoonensis TaxID=324851 RepID=A0ABP4Q5B8_9ACTN